MKMPFLIPGLISLASISAGGGLAAGPELPSLPARTESVIRAETDRLVGEGQRKEAFLNLLDCPGAEVEAAALALGAEEARLFLKALESRTPPLQGPRRHLVEAELSWKMGDKGKSVELHRKAIAGIAKDYVANGWTDQTLPRDFYPTVPEAEAGGSSGGSRDSNHCYRRPFQVKWRFPPNAVNPAHTPENENLWIRRFVAAEAWPEALAEYERIWSIYRDRLWPHAFQGEESGMPPASATWVRQPHGYSKMSLAFALSYTNFLRTQGLDDKADDILLDALLAMDMDRILPEDTILTKGGDSLKLPFHHFLVSGQRWSLEPLMGGVGRREFVNAAVAQLKAGTDRVAKVKLHLRDAMLSGRREVIRVLAAIEYAEGYGSGAMKGEEFYLSKLKLDDFSLAMRRGQYHDEFNLPAEAVRYYVQALQMPAPPAGAIRGYDAEPRSGIQPGVSRYSVSLNIRTDGATAPATSIPEPDGDPPEPGPGPGGDPVPGWRRWIQSRILTLAAVTNNIGAAAHAHLASLELPDGTLAPDDQIFSVARKLKGISLEVEMTRWASERLKASPPGQEPVALLFLLGRTDEALARLETRWKATDSVSAGFWPDWDADNWRERFAGLGKQQNRQFLEAFGRAFPGSPYGKAWLLSLHDGEDTPALIPWLVDILGPGETRNEWVFRRGRSPGLPECCRNPFQLAHRLMRLYRATGSTAELVSLGQRVKSGKQPFVIDKSWRDHGEWELWQRNCVALLQEVEEPKATVPVADAQVRGLFPWIVKDDAVELFASLDSVLAVAAATEGAHFFTGHPWGVAVFGADGKPQVRIPLGHAATHLAVSPGFVWAGTPNGLYRITAGTWAVHHLSLAESLSDPESSSEALDPFHAHKHAVRCLLMDGRTLWMGGGRVIQKLDLDSLEVTAFRRLPEVAESNRVDAEHLHADGNFVWLGSWWGITRYDKKSGAWQNLPPPPGGKWGETLTRAGNNLWALAELPGRSHALCRIEGEDLFAREVKMNGGSLQDKVFRPVREQGGMMLFAGTFPLWGWLPGSDQLVNLDRRMLTKAEWEGLPGPEGSSFAQGSGGEVIRARRYDRRDPASTQANDLLEQEAQEPAGLIEFGGGLNEIKKPWKAAEWEGVTRGSVVWDAVEDGQGNVWLCTNRGLTVVSATGTRSAGSRRSCLRHWGMDDGLVGERVCSGVWAGGRLWFAAMWGDHAGALMYYDPVKGQFGSRTKEDGLASNMISRLDAKDGQLVVHHGMEYDRKHEGESYLFTPSILDPQSMKLLRTGERSTANAEEKVRWLKDRVGQEWCPVLGGRLLSQRRTSSGVWYCGAHGAVFVRGGGVPKVVEYPPLPVRIVAGD